MPVLLLLAACGGPDGDGDGFSIRDGDCDDADASVNPTAEELPYNGVDDDCDPGSPDDDLDGDGAARGADCDDANPSIGPDALELCNGIDDNCNGDIDEDAADARLWYLDLDGDGFAGTTSVVACTSPGNGYLKSVTDCDDANQAISPGAVEVCDDNDVDEDCDGLADDADTAVDPSSLLTFYADLDVDGFGDPATPSNRCDVAEGLVEDNTDCDDTSNSTFPGAAELDVPSTACMRDADEDGFGDDMAQEPVIAGSDCDDADDATFPGATEVPNDGIDQSCAGADLPAPVADLVAGDLVITEIMKNPSAVGDTDGEWFEILNTRPDAVDLDGLYVADNDIDDFTVSGTVVVAAGAYALFAVNGASTANGGLPTVDYVYSGMFLANGDDELRLFTFDGGLLIDEVQYVTGFPNTAGASLSLDEGSDDIANDQSANWCDGSTTYGSGDEGTPRAPNGACP